MDCQCKPEIKQRIDSVHEEIYGNGNSNNSLVTRMARVETNMKLLLVPDDADLGAVGIGRLRARHPGGDQVHLAGLEHLLDLRAGVPPHVDLGLDLLQ